MRPSREGSTDPLLHRCHAAEKSGVARDKVPVPETDTGSQVENTKVREITLSKELGNLTS